MLKAILLLILSSLSWGAEEYATISVQRWNEMTVVTIDHDKGWHTYWKNPGDAGIASTFKFMNGTSLLNVKAHEWPAPKRYIEAGNIMTIGYSGRQHFFFEKISGPIEAQVGVLICKDICIPQESKIVLRANQEFNSNRNASAYNPTELKEAYENLPAHISLPAGFEYYLTRVKDQNLLTFHYSLKGASNINLPHELGLLTGFPHPPFGYKRETVFFKNGTLYGKTEIEWDGEYQDPPVPLPQDGNFSKPFELKFLINTPGFKKVEVTTLPVKDFSTATSALDDFYKGLGPETKTDNSSLEAQKSIFYYLALAFLGGLILNLMPCVLPVISLKLFGLIKHREYTQKKLFAHNLSYSLGVISTFMSLALVVAGIKATGEEIGWGFQLQSPPFILIMMLILFVLSLNLFGLFEFFTPGGQTLGSAKSKEGFTGDFFSGVLTTILATPCSAPFLGTALAFAFTAGHLMIFVIFFFIGLGLAFPFLMTAAFPKSLSVLPRPGVWMVKLKYFLGLSLVITTIWLYDVFVTLVDFELVSWRLNLLFALWFFAFFFAQKISGKRIAQFIAFALPLSMTVMALQNLPLRADSRSVQVESVWKPWTLAKLTEEKDKTIFMDFTAEWCLTCKVNKKLVLETDAFNKMAQENNLLLMRADWTKRDDEITQFLKAHGAVGVPAYFIQKPDGSIKALGETISIGKVKDALK